MQQSTADPTKVVNAVIEQEPGDLLALRWGRIKEKQARDMYMQLELDNVCECYVRDVRLLYPSGEPPNN